MFKGMSSSEFAKFVIDNMGRATLSNAMNIANNFNTDDGYDFKLFVTDMQVYLKTLISENKFSADKCYEILGICYKGLRKYNTSASKQYVIDDFIIEIWKVCNGH